jgi:hypothetical protein
MPRAAHLLASLRSLRAPAERRRQNRRDMPRSRETTTGAHPGAAEAPVSKAPLGRGLALHAAMALPLGLGLGVLAANAGQLAFPVPSLALALVGAGVVGLLAGLAARLTLRGWTRVFKFLLSLLTLLSWLAVAEVTYAVWNGLDPLHYLLEADDWVETGQLAVGCLTIVAVTVVGRRRPERMPFRWIRKSGGEAATPPRAKASLGWSLLLHLTVAVVVGPGVGVLEANASHLAIPTPPLVLALLGAGVAGLLLGLAACLTLRGWTEALKFLVVVLALLVWLAASEAAYAVWMGLHPLKYLSGNDNWVEMGQLAVGCLGAIVGGAIRRHAGPAETIPGPQRDRGAPPPNRRAERQLQGGATSPSSPRPSERVQRRPTLLPPRLRLPSRARRRGRLANNHSGVRVTGRAEDRCPYCLDVIERRDPRGVIVCDICGTPHHADCWEAGGKCQVPHLIT